MVEKRKSKKDKGLCSEVREGTSADGVCMYMYMEKMEESDLDVCTLFGARENSAGAVSRCT